VIRVPIGEAGVTDRLSDCQTAGVTLESPSLFAAGTDGPPAYELKFLLAEEQAGAVEAVARRHLSLDPHVEAVLGNAYRTTSLYTDTPGFEVLSRTGTLGRRKYRVRRYGAGGPVFLERKTKSGDRVRKRRIAVPAAELAALASPESPPGWAGNWFHRQLVARHLRPVCRIAYERVAYTGAADGGPARLTFDRRVRGVLADGWTVDPVGEAPVLLDGRVICEFKFRLALPTLFKGLIADLGLTPSTVSKYRLFMQAARPAAVGAADG
jgi:hypothetical protein